MITADEIVERIKRWREAHSYSWTYMTVAWIGGALVLVIVVYVYHVNWRVTAQRWPTPPTCTCYRDTDCGNQVCYDLGHPCDQAPVPNGHGKKLDGLCQDSEMPPVAGVVHLWLREYRDIGLRGGGSLDATALSRITVASRDLRPDEIKATRQAADVIMSRLFGWDFAVSPFPPQNAYVPSLNAEGAALLQAAITGIEGSNLESIKSSLRQFWEEYPAFRPLHTGRCYPHGHADVADLSDVIRCQTEAFERISFRWDQ